MIRVPLIKPDVPLVEDWAPLLETSYAQNTFSNYGPLVKRLIAEIDAEIGTEGKTGLPVANATVGLQVALQALNKPGGKVLTQAFTFPATVNAIVAAQMIPVFMDVDDGRWFVDPVVLDAELEQRDDVSAVMIVRTLGMCGEILAIEAACEKHDVALIVDSAGCFGGSESDGRKIGLAGTAEVFSFHATKPFSVGEGGLIYGDTAFMDRCKAATNFGLEGMTLISHGTNAKMSEVAAAISIARLKGFQETIVAPRTERAQEYVKRFSASNTVSIPEEMGNPTWQFFPVRMASAVDAEAAIARLAEAGYAVRGYYRPSLHLSGPYEDLERVGELTVSGRLAREIIVLPLHVDVTFDDINEIADIILSISND